MKASRIIAWGAVAALVVAVAGLWAWREGVPPFGAGHTTGDAGVTVELGGPFALTDQHGETVRDADFRGRYMLIYFGYTNCPDICVPALQNMSGALDMLGVEAKRVVPIFITVDPERDTVELLADYAENFHPRLVALTGTAENITGVVRAYRVYAKKAIPQDDGTDETAHHSGEESSGHMSGHDDYLMDHSGFIYLMGPDGKFIMVMSHDTAPDALADKIASHL